MHVWRRLLFYKISTNVSSADLYKHDVLNVKKNIKEQILPSMLNSIVYASDEEKLKLISCVYRINVCTYLNIICIEVWCFKKEYHCVCSYSNRKVTIFVANMKHKILFGFQILQNSGDFWENVYPYFPKLSRILCFHNLQNIKSSEIWFG
jgi:hypothetical protein